MADLPSGTVTFLFTDIEGSTTRWDQHPAAMRDAVARHDGLLRAAIAQHHGVVFKTVGDAFCVAFSTAPDAVAAALFAQSALQAEGWDECLSGIRVRMALHTGSADERAGDYFGPPVNRVARLLSAAAGGQTLLSGTTRLLVRDQLPPEGTLRDLGKHRLKDLSRPEHIYQLVALDLPSQFPPLKTLDSHPHNLPVQPTALVGRKAELSTLRTRLSGPGPRLVTLTGPGGVGKTRLALHAVADLLDNYPDGVWFVPLAAVTDPSLVLSTISAVLGVRETGGQSPAQALQNWANGKQALLLLDNFEQVVHAAPQLAALLSAAPSLKMVVTSRVILRLRGEQVLSVPVLAVPDPAQPTPSLEQLAHYDGVTLFLARARDAQADFALTIEHAPAVAAICHRLDGLPLAIELAAARISSLPPATLLRRLERRLKLLTRGPVDLPERQQTLRATIDWSYSLLDQAEKTLFARLAVFAGGCTVEAAEAICDPDGDLPMDVLDGLDLLVQKSLLRRVTTADEEPRFVSLETIKEYALEQLAATGKAATLRRRHADYYLALAEAAMPQLTGAEQRRWLSRLESEHDNLRAVLAWAQSEGRAVELVLRLAGALWRFWHTRGHFSEGRRWLEEGLRSPESTAPEVRVGALSGAGMLAQAQGDYARARSLHEESLGLCRALGDQDGIARSLNNLGLAVYSLGDYTRAQALHEESLSLCRALGDQVRIGIALNNLGRVAYSQGDYARAQALHEESLSLCRALGNQAGSTLALNNLGLVAESEGDYTRAQALHQESLSLCELLGDQQGIARSLNNLGRVAYNQRDYTRAHALHEESLSLCRGHGDRNGVARALNDLGEVASSQGDYGRAQILFEESLTLRRAIGNQAGMAFCLEGLAEIARAQQQPARAARLFGAAEALRERLGAPRWPAARPMWERQRAAVRNQLDEAAFAAAWAEGRALSSEAAMTEAQNTAGAVIR